MNRAQLKAMSKKQIKGNIGILFLILLIIVAISLAASIIPVVGSLASTFILTPAFSLSVAVIYINLTKNKDPEVVDVFIGFHDFWSSFKVSFLTGLLVFLWSLLFIIPGIVKSYSYSMAMYILAENKGMSAREAISRSKELMYGHKADLFVLQLSFIGWAILGSLTLGILYIWLVPYMSATYANFYNSIKGKQNVAISTAESIEG